MKSCFKCGVSKPLTEFYKHPAMTDGTVNKCKTCNKKDVIENRLLNREYYLQYDRNRPNADERNKNVIARTLNKYHSDEDYKNKILETKATWAKANPEKRKAQYYATNAVRDGRLLRKEYCEHCNEKKPLQKHHWSYLKEHWLDVTWLCAKCHGKEHKRLNELGRDPDKLTEK